MNNNTIYTLELESYLKEISVLEGDIRNRLQKDNNLTYLVLSISNRCNLILVGLCSLVEAYLLEIAIEEEKKNNFKINDLRGTGLKRLQTYLSRTRKINFGNINSWNNFLQVYNLRNNIVHNCGGLVEFSDLEKIRKSLDLLDIKDALVLEKRLRFNSNHLEKIHEIIEKTISSLISNNLFNSSDL